MSRREQAIWLVVAISALLAAAWLVERRWITSFRQELDAWGKESRVAD